MDMRVRDDHVEVTGEVVPYDKEFSNGLMFPGDPSGEAAQVINCRCGMQELISDEGIPSLRALRERFDMDMGFEEWRENRLTNAGGSGIINVGEVRADISENYNLSLRTAYQNRHIQGTAEYIEGRSILTADPEMLLGLYQGNGIIRFSNSGNWTNKEFFTHNENIGVWKNKQGTESAPTTNGVIHYSKRNGVHIIPSNPYRW